MCCPDLVLPQWRCILSIFWFKFAQESLKFCYICKASHAYEPAQTLSTDCTGLAIESHNQAAQYCSMCCGVDWVCIQVETLEFDYQSDISNTKTCSCCDTVSLPGRAATSLLSNLGSRGRIDWLLELHLWLVLSPDEQPQQKLAPAGPVEYCSKQRELETSLFLFFMQRRWRASRSSGADLPSSDHSDHLLGSLPVYTCKAGGKQNSNLLRNLIFDAYLQQVHTHWWIC